MFCLLDVLIALAVMAGIGAPVYFKWYRPMVQRKGLDRAGSRKTGGVNHHDE
jgi:hypothetical protein